MLQSTVARRQVPLNPRLCRGWIGAVDAVKQRRNVGPEREQPTTSPHERVELVWLCAVEVRHECPNVGEVGPRRERDGR